MSRLQRQINNGCRLQMRKCSNSISEGMGPNGIAHIQLSVSHKYWDETKMFYRAWLHAFYGMEVIFDNESTLYCVGCRTGVAISKCNLQFEHELYHQRRIGLHHVCFRMRSNEAVQKTYDFLMDYNKKQESDKEDKPLIKMIRYPENGEWAPGYYSILFEDFDGIRWECNYVPNKGWLDPKYKDRLPHNASFSKL